MMIWTNFKKSFELIFTNFFIYKYGKRNKHPRNIRWDNRDNWRKFGSNHFYDILAIYPSFWCYHLFSRLGQTSNRCSSPLGLNYPAGQLAGYLNYVKLH